MCLSSTIITVEKFHSLDVKLLNIIKICKSEGEMCDS